jgi:hypothetical protein
VGISNGDCGVYRFWRDMGYVAGGVIAGVVADALGFGGAIGIVAALTAASGLWLAVDLPACRASIAERDGAVAGELHQRARTL